MGIIRPVLCISKLPIIHYIVMFKPNSDVITVSFVKKYPLSSLNHKIQLLFYTSIESQRLYTYLDFDAINEFK